MENVLAKLYNSNLVRLLLIQVSVFVRRHVLYMHDISKIHTQINYKIILKSTSHPTVDILRKKYEFNVSLCSIVLYWMQFICQIDNL